ncbi:MAG: cyanophycinase [Spirochaetes bacterium]|nr:cyanophycinase [Spirochaetota bacterium]
MKKKQFLFTILIITFIFIISCKMPQSSFKITYGENKGSLVIIGGALKSTNKSVYNKIIELGGGIFKAKVAIFPTGSGNPADSGSYYKSVFMNYGIPRENIWVVPLAKKDDPLTTEINEKNWAENAKPENAIKIANKLKKYNIIFFTGGDQIRIRDLLMDRADGKYVDNAILKAIREIYKKGGVIAGTSAGAAIMTSPMIGGGNSLGAMLQGFTSIDNYDIPDDQRVFITDGPGFLQKPEIAIDQHAIKRGRFGRLIVSMIANNQKLGFAVDENTALIIRGNIAEVAGESGVLIIDLSEASYSNSFPLSAKNIKISYIEELDIYDYVNKKLIKKAYYKTLPTKNNEYYTHLTNISAAILEADVIKRLLIEDLVDHANNDFVIAIAFDGLGKLKGIKPGTGVKLIFRKGSDTNGWGGRDLISGEWKTSVFNVYLDIEPTQVSIKGVNQ